MPKQKQPYPPDWARRKIVKQSVSLAGAPLLGAVATGLLFGANRSEAALTPACHDAELTMSQGAGPFYTPNSPLRDNLREPGLEGESMRLSGRVLNQFCEPASGAILDFWHADSHGVYDNRGYRLRGHLFADSDGFFVLNTIVPGLYPGRTRHIHVITQGRDTRRLTTQLYFPDEAGNQRDFGFNTRLELKPLSTSMNFHFDFVLQG